MPTYGPLDNATVQKDLAVRILFQLYRNAVMPRTGVTEYDGDPGFRKMQTITITRPRIVIAQDYDPRSGVDATSEEPGYLQCDLTLEKLFTQGYPIFSHDAQNNVARYRRDYLMTVEGAIRLAFDQYLYDRCFRDYSSFADTGNVRIGATSPIRIVATDYTVGSDTFAEYDDKTQIRSSVALGEEEVPVGGRYMVLSHRAWGGFLGDRFAALNEPATLGQNVLENPGARFIMHTDFATAASNAVAAQVGELGTTFDSNAWDTTIYLKDDHKTDTPLEVLLMTAGVPGPNFGNFAKGKIIHFTFNSREVFGVILRVVGPDTIHVKPYYSDGTPIPLNTAIASADVTMPTIPSINIGYHQEHLVYATRLLSEPSPGSGANVARASTPMLPVVLQVFSGTYLVDQFKESNRISLLCGAKPTDYRKSVLVLSA